MIYGIIRLLNLTEKMLTLYFGLNNNVHNRY